MATASRHRRRRFADQKPNGKINQRRTNKGYRNQGVGERVAVYIAQSVKYLDRCDPIIVKHQRNTQCGKGPDENDGSAGEYSRHDKGDGYTPGTPQTGATEIFGGL